jgi:CheY-like chemotaxis protein
VPILIVDDDEVARTALSNTLAALGRPLLHAADGEEAWDLLSAGARPVVCCCDVMMPRLGGVALLQRAAGHPVMKFLPFILVSSAADVATVRMVADAGASGYILKPFLGLQARAIVTAVVAEHLALRADHFLAVRRRLGIDLAELEQRHHALLQACRALKDDASPAHLEWLEGVAAELGLRRFSLLLAELRSAPAEHAASIRNELARLVEERLQEIVHLAPAVASGFGPIAESLRSTS